MKDELQIRLGDLLDKANLQSQYMAWICDHYEELKSPEKRRMRLAKASRAGTENAEDTSTIQDA